MEQSLILSCVAEETMTESIGWLLKILLVVFTCLACILAISVNEGRLEDLANATRQATQLATALENRKPDSFPTGLGLTELQDRAAAISRRIDDITGQIIYGSSEARANFFDGFKPQIANWFHALSSDTNSFIIAISSCSLAFILSRLRQHITPRLKDMAFGYLCGLIALFIIKGGKSIITGGVNVAGADSSDPYGIAFFAAVAGLFSDQFFLLLQSTFERLAGAPDKTTQTKSSSSDGT
jgi:hypothetical protein